MWYRTVQASFGGGAVQKSDLVSVIAPETLQVLHPKNVSVIYNNSVDNQEEPEANLEQQLSQIRDENDVDVNMSTRERGNGAQYLLNGNGQFRMQSGKGRKDWQNAPSNETWV